MGWWLPGVGPDASDSGAAGHADGGARSTKPPGLRRWLTTVDHTAIGKLYLVLALVGFLWGGTDALMMRTELLTPATDVWNAETYGGLFTMHGLTMLFFFATPAIAGFANLLVPPLIGADDMAFPRINAIAFWLLPAALVLTRNGLLTDVVGHLLDGMAPAYAAPFFTLAPPAVGWTLYAPLSTTSPNPALDVALLGLHLSGVATIMAACNFIVTIFEERTVPWSDLDIFSWAMLTQSGLILFAFPVLGSAIVMLLLDRIFDTTFFAVQGGGPLLWQHLFWFFGHPEVYILVLPPMGLISLILPRFAGRSLFGFKFIVYSTLAIGVLSFGVWAHHMFATGLDLRLQASFMAISVAIAVPSAVKVFNWIATMWNGRLRLTTPMLFCVGSVSTFILGGVTGVFLAAIPVDLIFHGTYYVVGHFHLIIVGLIPFALFAAFYYWFPLLFDRMYDERLGQLHFALTFVGVWVAFTPLLLLGIIGLPRRHAAYPPELQWLQVAASVGAAIIALGQLVLLWNVVQTIRLGEEIDSGDPWGLVDEHPRLTGEWEQYQPESETESESE